MKGWYKNMVSKSFLVHFNSLLDLDFLMEYVSFRGYEVLNSLRRGGSKRIRIDESERSFSDVLDSNPHLSYISFPSKRVSNFVFEFFLVSSNTLYLVATEVPHND